MFCTTRESLQSKYDIKTFNLKIVPITALQADELTLSEVRMQNARVVPKKKDEDHEKEEGPAPVLCATWNRARYGFGSAHPYRFNKKFDFSSFFLRYLTRSSGNFGSAHVQGLFTFYLSL